MLTLRNVENLITKMVYLSKLDDYNYTKNDAKLYIQLIELKKEILKKRNRNYRLKLKK